MLVSTEEVQQLTGYDDISTSDIAWAQAIIEVHVGRTEPDVTSARDLSMLARAVAFQAVYMKEHGKMIYEQIDLKAISAGGTQYVFHGFDHDSPFIAPLAKKACSKLSWTRTRSVATGRVNVPQNRLLDWWTED